MIARHEKRQPLQLHAGAAAAVRRRRADAGAAPGASACECDVSEGHGLSVTVRKGAVDTIEHNRDKGIGVTAVPRRAARRAPRAREHLGFFAGRARSSTVEAALAIARHTAVDDCAGPPERRAAARARTPDLDLYHPWASAPRRRSASRAAARRRPSRCRRRSATPKARRVSAQQSQFVFANSLGFMGGFPTSRHSLSLSVIAEDRGGMQRDDWYSAARVPGRLAEPEALGRYAGRARARAPRRAPHRHAPGAGAVRGAAGGHAAGHVRVRGERRQPVPQGSLPRRTASGRQVFARGVNIEERPHEPRALASSPFDEEGVATRARNVVRDGVLRGLFPRLLFGAQARHAQHRQRGRQPQPRRGSRAGRTSAAC